MELQWSSSPCSYLRSCFRQIQNQEQTLELRLPEGMPDVGRVLCAWGQVQLLGKQWRSDSVSINGGVSVWVLYMPEDEAIVQSVEGWMPFQGKWPLPDGCREGVIRANVLLRSLDSRMLSPRKLLVRASLGLMAEALEPREAAVYTPDEEPQEVCILRRSYPLQLLGEAGEKQFAVGDTLAVPQNIHKLICCRLKPVLTEQAVTGGRVVLRGAVRGQYLALDEANRLQSGTVEMPFAQFAQLDLEHDKEAVASICMALCDTECMLTDDGLQLKCGLIAQYAIYDRRVVQVAEDAYSPVRAVKAMAEQLEMPVLLDRFNQPLDAQLELDAPANHVVDVAFCPDHPVQYREGDRLVVELPGMFQALYYDRDDHLQCAAQTWSGRYEFAAEEGCGFHMNLKATGMPAAAPMGEQLRLNCDLDLQIETDSTQQIPMLRGVQLGEETQPNPDRPSVIMCRAGQRTLWEIAKGCGSTVEAIRQANALTGQPQPEQMLLIPVM